MSQSKECSVRPGRAAPWPGAVGSRGGTGATAFPFRAANARRSERSEVPTASHTAVRVTAARFSWVIAIAAATSGSREVGRHRGISWSSSATTSWPSVPKNASANGSLAVRPIDQRPAWRIISRMTGGTGRTRTRFPAWSPSSGSKKTDKVRTRLNVVQCSMPAGNQTAWETVAGGGRGNEQIPSGDAVQPSMG